uniref:Uncharacterized protein n=1 Tax=Fagus sylvatica TaxID=28930 RepID=A0A2N9ICT8_FAGSY
MFGRSGRLSGFRGRLRSGFAGFHRYNNKHRKSTQQQQLSNHCNNKNHQITEQKTKQKISKYKLDRTGKVEGGAAAKPVRSGQNRRDLTRSGENSPDLARSLQSGKISPIWRDLTRSGEVSLDLEPLRGGGAGRDLPSPVVELDTASHGGGASQAVELRDFEDRESASTVVELQRRWSFGILKWETSFKVVELHTAVELRDFED